MRVFTGKPAIIIGAATWLGIALSPSCEELAYVALGLLCAAIGIALVISLPFASRLALIVGFFAIGILRSPTGSNRIPSLPLNPSNEPAVVRATIKPGFGCHEQRAPAIVEDVKVGPIDLLDKRVALEGLSIDARLARVTVDVIGRLYSPLPALNPGGFDARSYYRRRGYACGIKAENSQALESSLQPSWLGKIRSKFAGIIDETDPAMSGILRALLLGSRTKLNPDIAETMKRAGIYHVLAISGLHVGVAVLLITIFVRLLGLPRSMRILAEVALAFFYVVLTGSRPSAQRAFTFFALLGLSRLLQVRIDISNCIGAAVVLLLLAQPWLAWDIGFQLSVAAAMGISIILPGFDLALGSGGLVRRLIRYVGLCFMASVSAQTFTLPILAYHFGRVSPMGLFLNPIALPLVTLVVAGGLEGFVASLFSHSLARIFIKGSSLISGSLISAATHSLKALDLTLVTGRPDKLRMALCFLLLVLVVAKGGSMRRRVKLSLIVLVWLIFILPNPLGHTCDLEMTFLYVGHGDACVLESGGQTLLVDAGGSYEDWDAGSYHIIPFLHLKGIRRLDAVMISHPHCDHYGGLRSLIGRVKIGKLIVSTYEGDEAYRQVLEAARVSGIIIRKVEQGDSLKFGRTIIEVLSPAPSWLRGSKDVNSSSLVVRIVCGEFKALFTGDVPCSIQQKLAEEEAHLEAIVIKIPHHGRSNCLVESFLEMSHPILGIVSASEPGNYHAKAIAGVELAIPEVLKTYEDGAVSVKVDGREVGVSCFASKRKIGFALLD